EGMRQLDEYRMVSEKLPPLTSRLTIPRPLEPKLRDLGPEELDVFQQAMTADNIRTLLDESALTDLAVAEKLKSLLDKGFLIASS
ncbi:MAG TPA: hypothetical protein VNO55_05205, partial [Polyangia bacterium]|nr:hypothetical protein [Polyangia bacterium]